MAGITVVVLSGLGLICFIVPGVYLWFSWLVVMPVVVLERRAGREALTRASYLVRGRWWSVFGGFVLVELFIVLWTIVATVIVSVVVHVSSTNEAVAEQLASAFVELALAPIIVSFVSVTLSRSPTPQGRFLASERRLGIRFRPGRRSRRRGETRWLVGSWTEPRPAAVAAAGGSAPSTAGGFLVAGRGSS